MDKKVYVLVPVYNVEKVLRDCLDSVINQTYKNWEMILVDDGSKDRSGKICDEYVKRDSRIRVIHQENGGSSVSRLSAVKALPDDKNSYCMFSDSDDIMPNDAMEFFVRIADEYDCDIVSANFTKFLNIKKPNLERNNFTPINLKITEHDSIIKDLYYGFFGYGSIPVSLVAKLYKTNFLKTNYLEIKEYPYYFGDDLNITMRIFPKANRIATADNIVYYYRYGGGTNKFMKSFIDDNIFLYHAKKEYAVRYGVSNYYIGLIDVEMKNLALQYLIMCKRSKTYPHGKLADEIKYILDIPEFYNAASSISEETLKGDHSEVPGFTQAFVRKDVPEIERIAVQKANENRLKRFIRNLL